MRQHVLGAVHPEVFASACHLPNVLPVQDDFSEPMWMHREMLEVSTGAFGAEHPGALLSF